MSTSTLKNIGRGAAVTAIVLFSYGKVTGKTSETIAQNFKGEQTELSVGEFQPALVVEDLTDGDPEEAPKIGGSGGDDPNKKLLANLEDKTENYSDKLTSPDIKRLAIKWVEKGKSLVPAADRTKFEQVAREVIKDVNEKKHIWADEIAEQYGCPQREDFLLAVENGFYKDITQLLKDIDTANAQWRERVTQREQEVAQREQGVAELRQANAELRQGNAELDQANAQKLIKIKAGLPTNEQEILSLQNKSLTEIKAQYWEEIQWIVDLFIEYDYYCKPATAILLRKWGFDSEKKLKVQDEMAEKK